MFDHTSRYYGLETAIFAASDGHEIAYVRRRFVPRPEAMTIHSEVIVMQSDRLDLITARTLGDPLAFWWVADANRAMNPFDLTGEARTGTRLSIPLPQAQTQAHG